MPAPTIYYDETFDGVTPPALPSGSSSGGAASFATTNSVSYSGSNSLQITGTSTNPAWWAKLGTLDSNGGNNSIEAKFNPASVTTGSGSQTAGLFLRGILSPSGTTLPGDAIIFKAKMLSGATAFELGSTGNTGTYTTAQTNNVAVTFSAAAWYRVILSVQDWINTGIYMVTVYIQRMSDGAWLYPSGLWGSTPDVQTPFMSVTTTYSWSNGGGSGVMPRGYVAGWGTGTKAGVLTFMVNTEVFYVDDVIWQDVAVPTGVAPSVPASPGNEVELIASATSASDGGQTSHTGSNINTADTDFTDYYLSAATFAGGYNQYALLDAGSGNAVVPTGVVWSPGLTSDAFVGGYEIYMIGAACESAVSSSSGPWAQLGVAPTNQYPEPNVLTTVRFAGGLTASRYFRLRSPLTQCCINQFQILCTAASIGSASWRPARVSFSPSSGHFVAGQTVTLTTNTSGASIYYLVGTRIAPPSSVAATIKSTGTLYSSSFIIPSNAGDETIITAVAFHASGTTTLSAVTTAHFIVGQARYTLLLANNTGSGYVSIPHNSSIQPAGAFTIMAWVFVPAKQGGFNPVIAKETGVGATSAYYIGFNNVTTNGQIYFGFNAGGNEVDYAIPSASFYGVWHHIAGVFTGSGLITYVDGVNVASGGTSTAMNSSTAALRIGSTPFGPDFFYGFAADVAVVPSALSSTVIANIAAGTDSPSAHTPGGFWKLNDGIGTSVKDYSGNNNTGAFVGAPDVGWCGNAPSQIASESLPTFQGPQFVPDTCITGSAWFGNTSLAFWPADWYDTRGVLIQTENGAGFYEFTGLYWRIGNNLNSGNPAAVSSYRGHSFYSSPDLLNWTFQGQLIPCAPASAGPTTTGMPYLDRAHILKNPNPISPSKRYVIWGNVGADRAGCWTAPAMAGPWAWSGLAQPNSATVNDCNVFYDVVDDGTSSSRNKAWFIFTNNTVINCCQLDPATDWTSFTGSNTTLATGSTHSWPANIEAPIMFWYTGYYFLIASNTVPYGSSNSQQRYASATTMSGIASASSSSVWATAPNDLTVGFNAQFTDILQVQGLTSPGFIVFADLQDSGASPVNMYNARVACWPISSVTANNAVNALTSPGVLAMQQPAVWDSSFLPAPVTCSFWLWRA